MAKTMPCPLCGTEVEYEHVNHTQEEFINVEGSVNTPTQDWYKIYCRDVCRPFAMDESLQELLDSAHDVGMIISRFGRNIHKQTWPDSELMPLDKGWAQWIINIHRFAEVAAAQFGLQEVHIEYAGGIDWENPLFMVDHEKQRFGLRLHDPDADEIEIHSLVLWLSRLRQEANLVVPEALPGPDGESIQRVSKDGEKPRHCVLYRWLEGKVLANFPATDITSKIIEKLGISVALLHQHAASFEPPGWFTQPRYDIETFRGQLEERCADESLSQSQRAELKEIGRRRLQMMAEWGEEREVFGLIQPDLSGLNVLVHGEEIRIIDFQECKWAHYLPNILQVFNRTLWNKKSAYPIFLEAYQRVRPLPKGFEAYYELSEASARLGWTWWR